MTAGNGGDDGGVGEEKEGGDGDEEEWSGQVGGRQGDPVSGWRRWSDSQGRKGRLKEGGAGVLEWRWERRSCVTPRRGCGVDGKVAILVAAVLREWVHWWGEMRKGGGGQKGGGDMGGVTPPLPRGVREFALLGSGGEWRKGDGKMEEEELARASGWRTGELGYGVEGREGEGGESLWVCYRGVK